jgi:hypothetical protein
MMMTKVQHMKTDEGKQVRCDDLWKKKSGYIELMNSVEFISKREKAAKPKADSI